MFATALLVAQLPTAGRAYTPEQQQACTNDAFRICGSEIPDVDRVTACMVRNKAQLSPECRAQFRPDPEPEPSVAAGRPTNLKPATVRRPASVKPRKSKTKKPAAT